MMTNEKGKPEDSLAERRKRAEIIQNLPARVVAVGEPLDKKTAENTVRSITAIENENDGRVATIPVNTIGKIWWHKGFDVSRIFCDLPDLYKTSILALSEDNDGHKYQTNIKKFHQYVNKFTDGNAEYYIRFSIMETTQNKNLIHSTAISNVETYKKSDSSYRSRVIDPGERSEPLSINIDNKNDHSNRIRVMISGGESPSPFIDKKLQDFFDL